MRTREYVWVCKRECNEIQRRPEYLGSQSTVSEKVDELVVEIAADINDEVAQDFLV